MATPYAPMAVLVRRWGDLRRWLFRRFPHQWVVKAWGWANAVKPDYHRLTLFFYVLQIYPVRGVLPDLTEPPTNADEIEVHRKGLENAPPNQTVLDPAKQIGSMIKITDLDLSFQSVHCRAHRSHNLNRSEGAALRRTSEPGVANRLFGQPVLHDLDIPSHDPG